ncbi:MAG: hypothetical protein IJ892_04385, partial [Prevotella sp.]|nr:hypothetical protein [Prevotella sp.]
LPMMAANAANLKVAVFFPTPRHLFPICRGLNPLKRHLNDREQQEMKKSLDHNWGNARRGVANMPHT